jgi:hypothetical protein
MGWMQDISGKTLRQMIKKSCGQPASGLTQSGLTGTSKTPHVRGFAATALAMSTDCSGERRPVIDSQQG